MSDVTIKIKRSLTPGNTPDDLSLGELAVNIPDRKIFIGDNSTDGIALIVDGTATGGSGTPAGSNTEIQFNDNSAFGSSSKLTWQDSASCGSLCTTSYLEFKDRAGIKLYENTANGNNFISFLAPANISDTSGKPYIFPEGTSTTGSVLTLVSANNGAYTLNWTKIVAASSVTADTFNKLTITAPTVGSTLTIADTKTLSVSNTLSFSGTDSSSIAFGTGGTVAYVTNKLSVFANTTSTELGSIITDKVGTGSLVFSNAPTLTGNVYITGNLIVSGYIETDTGIRGNTDTTEEYLGYGMVLDGGLY